MGFAETQLIPLVDEGLGNSAYLVDLGDGRALAVDVSRDLRAVHAETDRRGLRLAFAADTHLHADFVSGARQLTADGTVILGSSASRRAFDHVGLRDGDEVDLGGLTVRALATPGHTDEHLSYLLLDGDTPRGVFTGGSLIVGAAARTDLVDPARTRELAHLQYHSLQRLIELPDPVEVWPTHGSGSFCSAPPGARRTSTIGREKATNPLLAAPDADAFADQLIGGLGGYPAYFRHLVAVNRAGPAVLAADPVLGRLDVSGTRRALADGAVLVDVRPVADFAAGHIPGAVSIPLRGQFATWLGSVIDPATPVVIVRGPGQDPAEICWQALKIGYERLVGELDLDDWRTGSGRLVSLRLLHPAQVGVRPVLDVRQAAEYATGHLSGAINIELGDLSACAGDLDPDAPYAVMCGHGERASTAASLLARAGCTRSAVVSGGPDDWANATGRMLLKGP